MLDISMGASGRESRTCLIGKGIGMAGQQSAKRRAGVFDSIDDWMEQRSADLRRLGRQAENAGREAWAQATRTGENIAAMRPGDVAALGARVLDRHKPQAQMAAQPPRAPAARPTTPTLQQPRSTAAGQLARGATDQLLAGARGAQDAFTFGAGDRLYAGALALGDAANGSDLRRAYEGRMARERARDQYDAQHYGTARTVGQVLGTGAQIAALGSLEGAVAAGAHIPQATQLIAREHAVIGGAGAATGLSGQAISDAARGRRGSFGDYAGAAIGGALGAAASLPGRASYAGAAAGAATALAQDLFNHRKSSPDGVRQAALAGSVMGGVGGILGRRWSNGLSRKEKEMLGEDFSRLRTWARGDKTVPGPKTREALQGGGYTVPDSRTYRGLEPRDIVESKFGRRAELSKRQRQAWAQLPNYRVDHTLPSDVGAVVGFPAAEYAYQSSLSDE